MQKFIELLAFVYEHDGRIDFQKVETGLEMKVRINYVKLEKPVILQQVVVMSHKTMALALDRGDLAYHCELMVVKFRREIDDAKRRL